MFYNNIDHRTRVSLVLGFIISYLLDKYVFDDILGHDENLINGLVGIIAGLIITIMMISAVYFVYPVFRKKKE